MIYYTKIEDDKISGGINVKSVTKNEVKSGEFIYIITGSDISTYFLPKTLYIKKDDDSEISELDKNFIPFS